MHEDGDKPGAGGPSSKSGVLDTCFGVWMGFSAFRFLAALDLRHGVLVAGFSFLLFGVGSCFFFLVFEQALPLPSLSPLHHLLTCTK